MIALGAVGLQAQEVVDLPAEDLPLSVDFEPVYRIGSALGESEWEEFTAIGHIASTAWATSTCWMPRGLRPGRASSSWTLRVNT
ncbi:hypothetical protein [Candidatus Palauibacter sp.]|uniref:hypothetical protein n=1 Tax=Candidatus Palauibacter sp. TaxID=3101350 RepID=UPI003AF2FA75